MANYQVIKRLETILHLLESYPNRTKQQLMERLEDDYDILTTARTLERDFNALETDFGIEIHYDRGKKGYSINKEDIDRVSEFLEFSGRIYLGDLLRKGLKEFHDLRTAVRLEDYSDFKGIRFVWPVLLAIKKGCDIRFNHENFQKETQTDYQITPLQLREYQGRWYVIGLPKGEKDIKTFGLERISDLKILGLSDWPVRLLKNSWINLTTSLG